MPVKLVIVVETEKEKIQRKEFVFDNTKVTEATRRQAPISTSPVLYWSCLSGGHHLPSHTSKKSDGEVKARRSV